MSCERQTQVIAKNVVVTNRIEKMASQAAYYTFILFYPSLLLKATDYAPDKPLDDL